MSQIDAWLAGELSPQIAYAAEAEIADELPPDEAELLAEIDRIQGA